MRKHFALSILFFLTTINVFTILSCTRRESAANEPTSKPFELISTMPHNFMGQNYQIENYRLRDSTNPVYFQVIPGCSNSCPAVVISMPYHGIPWSNETADIEWSNKFPTGALTDDVNGPDYTPGSGQQIAYFHSSVSETVGYGSFFLPSKVNVVIVYNRFYLGRKMDQYVNDFIDVVNTLKYFSYIDTSKMGFLGTSLGGFVSLHASRKTDIKPAVVVGITPLLDLKKEQEEMRTADTRITSNPALLQSTQNFFNSYLRRINSTTVDQFTSQSVASENTDSKILVIHDTWDTIVSINQYYEFVTQRAIDAFIFQHASAINYNTFIMDHSQAGEGYTHDKALPVYISYLLNRIKSTDEEKIIYYTSSEFLNGITEIKAAQSRNQSISWFKNFIQDLCSNGIVLKDYSASSNLGTLTGQKLAGGIIVNIWGAPTTIDNGCAYAQANPNIFD